MKDDTKTRAIGTAEQHMLSQAGTLAGNHAAQQAYYNHAAQQAYCNQAAALPAMEPVVSVMDAWLHLTRQLSPAAIAEAIANDPTVRDTLNIATTLANAFESESLS